MVYEKKRSGDPDYDDKQPPEFHAGGEVVSAGDGVRLSKVTGPSDEAGAHVNLVTDTETLDNRPKPGETATMASLVQDYQAEDTPTTGTEVEADAKDIEHIKAGQAAALASNLEGSGLEVDPSLDSDAPSPSTPGGTSAATPKATSSKTAPKA